MAHRCRAVLVLVVLSLMLVSCDGDSETPVPTAANTNTATSQSVLREATTTRTPRPSSRTVVSTGNDQVDATLNVRLGGEELSSRTELVAYPCVDDANEGPGPPCEGDGADLDSFVVIADGRRSFLTDSDAQTALREALAGPSYTVHFIAIANEDAPSASAFVVGLRRSSANMGPLLYISESGGIVGLAHGAVADFGEEPVAGVEYVCGPSLSPDCYK